MFGKLTLLYVALLILILTIPSCSTSSPDNTSVQQQTSNIKETPKTESSFSSTNKIRILATTPLIAEWVNYIGGERVSADHIIPFSVNTHTYVPGAKDIAKITDAEYVFAVGWQYEGLWLDKLLNSHKDIVLVTLTDFIPQVLSSESEDGHSESEDGHSESEDGHSESEDGHSESEDGHSESEDGHSESEDGHSESEDGHSESEDGHSESEDGHAVHKYDPHFWFDPNLVLIVIESIAEVLSDIDPAGHGYYEERVAEYAVELKNLDHNIVTEINKISPAKRKVLTEHESLGYLGRRYNIEVLRAVIPSLSSKAGPTPKDLTSAIKLIRQHSIEVIFLEQDTNGEASQRIAEETGVKVVTGLNVENLNPNQSYIDFITYNIDLIVSNLRD